MWESLRSWHGSVGGDINSIDQRCAVGLKCVRVRDDGTVGEPRLGHGKMHGVGGAAEWTQDMFR